MRLIINPLFTSCSTFQSTHSRGVRRRYRPNRTSRSGFNPRTHEECDCNSLSLLVNFLLFQSTHSRGVRPFEQNCTGSQRIVSIHALTRSATLLQMFPSSNWSVSIHALTRSATFGQFLSQQWDKVSIHALTRSATGI